MAFAPPTSSRSSSAPTPPQPANVRTPAPPSTISAVAARALASRVRTNSSPEVGAVRPPLGGLPGLSNGSGESVRLKIGWVPEAEVAKKVRSLERRLQEQQSFFKQHAQSEEESIAALRAGLAALEDHLASVQDRGAEELSTVDSRLRAEIDNETRVAVDATRRSNAEVQAFRGVETRMERAICAEALRSAKMRREQDDARTEFAGELRVAENSVRREEREARAQGQRADDIGRKLAEEVQLVEEVEARAAMDASSVADLLRELSAANFLEDELRGQRDAARVEKNAAIQRAATAEKQAAAAVGVSTLLSSELETARATERMLQRDLSTARVEREAALIEATERTVETREHEAQWREREQAAVARIEELSQELADAARLREDAAQQRKAVLVEATERTAETREHEAQWREREQEAVARIEELSLEFANAARLREDAAQQRKDAEAEVELSAQWAAVAHEEVDQVNARAMMSANQVSALRAEIATVKQETIEMEKQYRQVIQAEEDLASEAYRDEEQSQQCMADVEAHVGVAAARIALLTEELLDAQQLHEEEAYLCESQCVKESEATAIANERVQAAETQAVKAQEHACQAVERASLAEERVSMAEERASMLAACAEMLANELVAAKDLEGEVQQHRAVAGAEMEAARRATQLATEEQLEASEARAQAVAAVSRATLLAVEFASARKSEEDAVRRMHAMEAEAKASLAQRDRVPTPTSRPSLRCSSPRKNVEERLRLSEERAYRAESMAAKMRHTAERREAELCAERSVCENLRGHLAEAVQACSLLEEECLSSMVPCDEPDFLLSSGDCSGRH